jgi:hypothetical protein
VQRSGDKNVKLKYKGVASKNMKARSASSFVPKKLKAMLRTAKQLAGKSIYRSVAMDGVRAGGAEWCLYPTTDPESKVSHFMPPKAGWLNSRVFFRVGFE